MTTTIRLATHDDAPALDDVLANAFFDDPVSHWMLPNAERRKAHLRLGMGHVLREVYLPKQGAWATDALDGVAMWGKPGDPKPSTLHELRGLPTFARTFGRHLPRALRAFGSVEKRRPSEPHWFLDILAVRPDRQGQGVGSSLLTHALAEADRAGVPAFLGTSNQRDLALYERFGFVVSEEFDTGPVHVWAMLRQPKPG
jgi:predicted N-acetyltransferase YhbS